MSIAIVDPRPAWCGTIAARVIESGFDTVRRCGRLDEAVPALLAAPPEIMLLSRLSSRHLPRAGMLSLKQRTKIVLVIERGETISADDLPSIGIEAVLASDASAKSFADCLACVLAGRAWLEAALLAPFLQRNGRPDWNCLSLREREVARLAALGLSNKRIARALLLSDGTVKSHMHHVLSKLGVPGREALAAQLPETVDEEVAACELAVSAPAAS